MQRPHISEEALINSLKTFCFLQTISFKNRSMLVERMCFDSVTIIYVSVLWNQLYSWNTYFRFLVYTKADEWKVFDLPLAWVFSAFIMKRGECFSKPPRPKRCFQQFFHSSFIFLLFALQTFWIHTILVLCADLKRASSFCFFLLFVGVIIQSHQLQALFRTNISTNHFGHMTCPAFQGQIDSLFGSLL